MSITGSLEIFSLPELFQIIESGRKSGKLSINTGSKINNMRPELGGTFYLWFDRGYFVAIGNSLKYSSLITEIQNNGWTPTKLLLMAKNSRPKNRPIGTYLKQKNLLLISHIELLFQLQLEEVNKLFRITSAEFKFEEIDNDPKISSYEKNFPWEEMTGKQKKATEISLEAMRKYFNWEYFKEKIPPGNSGLNKLVDRHDFQLVPLENYLWNTANGNVSLQKIAQERQVSLKKIQQTALSMIFAGLLEEVSIINLPMKKTNYSIVSSSKSNFADINDTNISNNQPKISNSLLNNLIAFLRKHF